MAELGEACDQTEVPDVEPICWRIGMARYEWMRSPAHDLFQRRRRIVARPRPNNPRIAAAAAGSGMGAGVAMINREVLFW